MRLTEVAPYAIKESIESLAAKLASAKAGLRELKSKAATFTQSGRAPMYDSLIKRAQAEVTAAQQEVAAAYDAQKAIETNRNADRSFERNRAIETPQQKRERLSAAMHQGHLASKQAGTMAEKAATIQKIYDELSNGGKYQLHAKDVVEKASKAIGVEERTIYRWLEVVPEFLHTARLLGLR